MTGIVAMNGDGCIGRAGAIPWHHPEDLKFFKRTTSGGTIVMGRKTWDGLPRRPLPKRHNVVLTHQRLARGFEPNVVFTDLDRLDAVLAGAPAPVFVIGGAAIFDALWDRIDLFLVTRVPDEIADGDTFFPHALEPEFALDDIVPLSDDLTVERWVRRVNR